MPCPKCNGRLVWKDRSWTSVGEDPGHWGCIACGKVIYPDRAGRSEAPQNIIPSSDCDEKGGEGMRTDQGKECSRKECKRRGQVLPFGDFNKNVSTPDGYEYHCRICKQEEAQARRDRIKKGVGTGGNGRRKRQSRGSGRVRDILLPTEKLPVVESLFMDPTAIRSIKRSVGKEILSEFSKFLEARYA